MKKESPEQQLVESGCHIYRKIRNKEKTVMVAQIMVLESKEILRNAICDTLSKVHFETIPCENIDHALNVLKHHKHIDLLLCEFPADNEKEDWLNKLRPYMSKMSAVFMGEAKEAAGENVCSEFGVRGYLEKPFDADALVNAVNNLTTKLDLEKRGIVAADDNYISMLRMVERIAEREAHLLVTGESGVGKEVLVRYFHQSRKGNPGPFVAVNCAAIPDNMLEAVLFGYEKGAFTGAYKNFPGKFAMAQDGTLLLDEISEMDLSLQAKLLRVLQEKEVEPLGSTNTIKLNVLVCATSNKNLEEEVKQGRFRADLYYRLNVLPIQIMPLRYRKKDIVPLARFFLERVARSNGEKAPVLSSQIEKKLMEHDWPGNVRELDNLMQRTFLLHTSKEIREEDITFLSSGDDLGNVSTTFPALEIASSINGARGSDEKKITPAKIVEVKQKPIHRKVAGMRSNGSASSTNKNKTNALPDTDRSVA